MVATNHIDYSKLDSAQRHARKVMAHTLSMRKQYIREYAGKEYSASYSDENREDIPLNMLHLDVGVKTRQLAPKEPRCLVTTWETGLKPLAGDLEIALNQFFRKVKLGRTLAKLVTEAMFGMGVVKTGIDVGNSVYDATQEYHHGRPFVDVVELEDFLFDPASRDIIQDASWMCCKNRVTYEYVMENTMFDPAVQKMVKANDPDEENRDNSALIWGGEQKETADSYGKWVDLYYYWFPYDRTVATFATSSRSDGVMLMREPLHEAKWEGPCDGPFRILSFIDVPGNPVPVAPVSQIWSLHTTINKIANKVFRMAKSKKDIWGLIGGDDEDIAAIKKARHGEGAKLKNNVDVSMMEFGRVDQTLVAMMLQLKSLASYMAGNLDLQGGLNSQSETLGQDKMLGASASKQIDDMQAKVSDVTTDLMRDLGYYFWSDPLLNEKITKPLEGTPFYVNRIITPEDLEGEWEDFEINFEPYSAVSQTPSSQLQLWSQIFTNFILPNMQALQAQGASIDMVALMKKIGKYANIPDLPEILMYVGPPSLSETPTHISNAKPPTHSVYERRNTSKKSPEAKEQEQIQNMMAGANGGKE